MISKSNFVRALQCQKSLWLNHHCNDLKDLLDEKTKSKLETGNEINELARKYFGDAVKASDDYFDVKKAVSSTNDLVAKNEKIIFEATAIIDDGCHARIDVLRKNDGNNWDLIEVKGSTSFKPSHLNDLAFQYHVFSKAGYKIDKCLIMLVNSDYILKETFDLKAFFKFEDITKEVREKQPEVEKQKLSFLNVIEEESCPNIKIGARCFEKKDHHQECDFKSHCWKGVPEYSVFDIYINKKAEEVVEKIGSYEIKNIPEKLFPSGSKVIDIECYKEDKIHIDRAKLQSWLSKLQYPLYFLDYETFQLAIPLFENSRPYQQIPFQFSLHIQDSPESEPKHFEFLHKEKSDPRKEFAKSLLEFSKGQGSIVSYNQSFEKGRNEELGRDFPEFSEELNKLNSRFVDLMEPFRSRFIYNPKQQSSYSIKYVLPAFTDLSYNEMEIANGGEAMEAYLSFIKGDVVNKDKMFKNLRDYCKLDTLAMVELLKVLGSYL